MLRSRSTLLLLLLVLLAGGVTVVRSGADAAVRPPAGVIVGINANTLGYGSSAGTIQSQLRKGNIRDIREDMLWSVVEPRRGARRWARYDRLFADAARRGLRILPLLQGTPRWAGRTAATMPDDPRAFAAFTGRFAARYGPDGTFWKANPDLPDLAPTYFEIWNEPSNPVTVAGDIDPGRYARLYQAVVRQSRLVAPRARFLIYADGQVQVDGRWVSWIDELFAAVPDLKLDVQGISVHPYGKDVSGYTPGRDSGQFARVRSFKAAFAEKGADVPLWVTEIGWSTCRRDERCVSEARQAALVRELMSRLRTSYKGIVSAVYFFSYADPGDDAREYEHQFGLTGYHREPKPGWRELTSILGRKPQR